MSKLWQKLTIFLVSGWLLFAAGNCTFLGLAEEEDDNSDLLNLLALFFIANQNQGCRNSSGLVICIPPGLRQ
jgi:hypothetical protein